MTTWDIRAHLREMYDVDVSPLPGHQRRAGRVVGVAVTAARAAVTAVIFIDA
jgi:hypothetical protein